MMEQSGEGIRLRLTPIVVFLSAAGAQCIWAQAPPVAHLKSTPFMEEVRREAPVSAKDIVGIAVGATAPADGAAKIFVRRPGGADSLICVEAVSLDGSYLASNTYVLPAANAGTYVEIPVDSAAPAGTKLRELYKMASFQTMAIVAHTGACGDGSTELLPTAWGHPPPSGTGLQLTFAVQSGRSTAYLLLGDNGKKLPCIALTDGRRTEFDAICKVPVSESDKNPISLRLQRCAFDDCTLSPAVRVQQ
jgi:hypothetical protein